jgi:uncharacterized radical SAM superfamily Fe-S cluster-containing enzyme
MSYYKDYIKGLCPECEDWVVAQICGELNTRDAENAKLKKELEEFKSAMNFYFGPSEVFERWQNYLSEKR